MMYLHFSPTYLWMKPSTESQKGPLKNDWFNKEHNLNITKSILPDLLRIATKNQFFRFEGNLCEQVDGVAMGSPLGPPVANAFMCNIEEQLETENKMPPFYKRYVDNTLDTMPDVETAFRIPIDIEQQSTFCRFHNGALRRRQPSFYIRNECRLDTKVYRKPTDIGLL